MRNFILSFVLLLSLLGTQQANAQAFGKGTSVISLGIGGARYWRVYDANSYYNRYYSFGRLVGVLNVQGEFAVHDYVGVGFVAGLGVNHSGAYNYTSLYIPVGVVANFHFYQLIDDKASKDMHANKLDVYVGVNVGAGPNIYFDSRRNTDLGAFAFGGPQVGVRYYPKSSIGIFAELGYGKTFANFGMAVKLGGK